VEAVLARMKHLALALLLVASRAFFTPNPEDFNSLVGEEVLKEIERGSLTGLKPAIFEAARNLVTELKTYVKDETPTFNKHPYYRWVPLYLTTILPGGSWSTSSRCYNSTSVTISLLGNDGVNISLKTNNDLFKECQEMFFFATLTGFDVVVTSTTDNDNTYTVSWSTTGLDDDEIWDLTTKGIRVFLFVDDVATTIYDLEQTLDLFCGHGLPCDEPANAQFMADYVGQSMPQRDATPVQLNDSDVHPGDFLGQMFMGGFETMIAWGMGSMTSHTAIVMQDPNTLQMMVCESTDPIIRCTDFQTWVYQWNQGALVTLAPLSPEVRATFNQTAAWNYIQTQLNYSYGYMNFLWGWIDTMNENFPCVPPYPDNSLCLVWQHIEILTGLVEKVSPPIAETFYRQAFRLRLNNTQLPDIASIYRYGVSQGIDSPTLYTMVELDSYRYNTTQSGNPAVGQSMVCDVFVCNVWKAAGIFNNINNDFNCAELTNWDDYCLTIFDPNYQTTRPPQCQAHDPTIPECQLMGNYQLAFNNYMTRDPYPHMSDHCPGQPPNYTKPSNC